MAHGQGVSDRVYGERKRALFSGLKGNVLEIGAGTGANLAWFPAGSAGEPLAWTGLDPNPWMTVRARQRAAELHVPASFLTAPAEAIPAEAGTFDAVVCTLVLCSVGEPARVLAEVRRVLRPGGRFVFLEHVAAPVGTTRRVWQDRVAPAWRWLADGCNPNRETEATIAAAGFAGLDVDRFEVPFPGGLISPQIAGVATR
jgi:ubiquinone/menaquinone biosynthesis C-methylase UbiE